MKKVFIDCGGHNGSSVRRFCKLHPDYMEWEIYSFEPDVQHWKNWNPGPATHAQLIKKAVNTGDDVAILHRVESSTTQEGGSTLNFQKAEHNRKKMEPKGYRFEDVLVNSIHLSKWIIDNFDINDYIILKIDVEGAEYDIFDDMLGYDTLAYINELYGEWHNWRCGRCPRPQNVKHYKSPEDLEYEKVFKEEYNLEFKEWDAIDEQ